MFKRKIDRALSAWMGRPKKKALLIKGARQVGKTTSIRKFGQENYQNLVEINFEKTPTAKGAFNGNLDANTIILNLSALGFGPFQPGKTLIFFDEVQSCPQARTAVKFLVEDGRFDVIESGSLLGINYREVSSYPVGFEEQIEMFPLDFEEFLWANNVDTPVIDKIKECYQKIEPVPDFIHQSILCHLAKYFIIGGMPEAVSVFVETSDITQVSAIQASILNGYRQDISKYAGTDSPLVKSIFDSIPAQLSKEDKRFILASMGKGAGMRKYGNAIEWICDAGIAYQSFNLAAFQLPFPLYEKRNIFKLYFLDTGLLSHICLNELKLSVLNGELEINQGALIENFVATELRAHGHDLHYYDKKSRNELDFLYPSKGKIQIIEVKSGKNFGNHASLNHAAEEFESLITEPIVLCKENVAKGEQCLYMPLYMAMFL